MQTLGQRIEILRRNKGLTLEQVAEKLEVSSTAVSNWNSRSKPRPAMIVKIAELFEVSTAYILYGEIERTSIKDILDNAALELSIALGIPKEQIVLKLEITHSE